MKVLRLASLLCVSAAYSFGASKEIVEMQRDISILQDQLRTVQRTLDEKLAQLTLLVQQTQDNASKTNSSVSNMQNAVSESISQQIQPMLQVGNKIEGFTDDMHNLRDSINDLNSRMAKLDAKVTDIGNRMSIMQNPPAAPGAETPGGAPTAATGQPQPGMPPAGMTAEATWANAERDRLGGNFDLALKEYQDYVTYFANTEYAPAAQYAIGEIAYNRGDYTGALKAFDSVLERFPDNPKTRSAHLMKGQTLVRSGDRNGAIKEFRYIIDNYPRTEDSRRATDALKGLGVATSAKPSPARRHK
jgi:TolA-binding protein